MVKLRKGWGTDNGRQLKILGPRLGLLSRFAGHSVRPSGLIGYSFSFSQKVNGLTKMITSPGFAFALGLPQVFVIVTPSCKTRPVDRSIIFSHE